MAAKSCSGPLCMLPTKPNEPGLFENCPSAGIICPRVDESGPSGHSLYVRLVNVIEKDRMEVGSAVTC
jgi:hypothetical protein